MMTKELLKTEIDYVQEDYLDVLYRIIKVFESPAAPQTIEPHRAGKQRPFGSARGLITIADDFNEPLEDFQEYM